MLVPPITCLVAPERSDPGGAIYARMVLRAAEEVAAA